MLIYDTSLVAPSTEGGQLVPPQSFHMKPKWLRHHIAQLTLSVDHKERGVVSHLPCCFRQMLASHYPSQVL